MHSGKFIKKLPTFFYLSKAAAVIFFLLVIPLLKNKFLFHVSVNTIGGINVIGFLYKCEIILCFFGSIVA